MKRMITKCPGCQGTLHIAKLQCPDCGMELKNDFALSRFDRLDDAQYEFLLAFLKSRGSLKEVQAESKKTAGMLRYIPQGGFLVKLRQSRMGKPLAVISFL